jgi:transposase
MQIPIEQLLNLPDIQVLNVEITEREIKCDIESSRGYSICHQCGQKANNFFEHAETLKLRRKRWRPEPSAERAKEKQKTPAQAGHCTA